MFQVHDYKGVSFLRQAPQVKAASTETIRVFATAYPELLRRSSSSTCSRCMGLHVRLHEAVRRARTIVRVPVALHITALISTSLFYLFAKKFHPMANGANLAKEGFGGSKVPLAQLLPSEYGGKGADLKTQGTEPAVE
ncbi:hypothetical protein NUW58_g9608 [Xylaria curta]|uniref:Uncharacterized protein n=1 Tax=Xylaria curta TaxID=42375 RepID=A0ACC1MW37_9PEZI|nr:hypothetical protein NUW58_g9608 [Xylaria curta]